MFGGDSVCGGESFAVFNLTPCTARVDEGIRVHVTGLRVQGPPVHYLSFSVAVVGVNDTELIQRGGRSLSKDGTRADSAKDFCRLVGGVIRRKSDL